jgi:hypothetical protein
MVNFAALVAKPIGHGFTANAVKYYEDTVVELAYSGKFEEGSFDHRFIESLSNQAEWTTRQFDCLKKLFDRNKIDHSSHRLRTPVRESNRLLEDEIRFLGDNLVIVTNSNRRYSEKQEILTELGAEYIKKHRFWQITIDNLDVIDILITYAEEFGATVDEITALYLESCDRNIVTVDVQDDAIHLHLVGEPLLECFIKNMMIGEAI